MKKLYSAFLEWSIVLAVWIWGLVPSIHWFDTAELTLSVHSLGIGHPPGQPPFVAFASPLRWLPIGDFAQRIALFSALMGGICVLVARSFGSSGRIIRLTLALTGLVALQSVRAEVYALSAALTLLSVRLLSIREDCRLRWLGSFCFGLSLANHPIIALGAVPFFRWEKKLAIHLFFFSIAALILIYLPIRASQHPAWDFGHPATFQRLLWFLQGKMYGSYSGGIGLKGLWENLRSLASMLNKSLSVTGVLIFLVGTVTALVHRKENSIRGLLSVLLAIFFLIIQNSFSPINPDALGYMLAAVWILSLVVSDGMNTLERYFSRRWMAFSVVALLLAWSAQVVTLYFQEGWLRKDQSAHRHLADLLEEPAWLSEVQTGSYTTYGIMRYGQVVEGRRPDLIVLYRGLPPDAVGRKSQPHLSNVFWELAFLQNSKGEYELRPEDVQMISKFEPAGWFMGVSGKKNPDWLDRLYEQNRKVHHEIGPFFGLLGEEAAQNYMAKILYARMVGDVSIEKKLSQQFAELFPYLNLGVLLPAEEKK